MMDGVSGGLLASEDMVIVLAFTLATILLAIVIIIAIICLFRAHGRRLRPLPVLHCTHLPAADLSDNDSCEKVYHDDVVGGCAGWDHVLGPDLLGDVRCVTSCGEPFWDCPGDEKTKNLDVQAEKSTPTRVVPPYGNGARAVLGNGKTTPGGCGLQVALPGVADRQLHSYLFTDDRHLDCHDDGCLANSPPYGYKQFNQVQIKAHYKQLFK